MRIRPLIAIALFALTLPLLAQTRERASVPPEYTWNLADIYPSDAAWRAAKENLEGQIPKVAKYNGTLSQSPERLLEAAELVTNLTKELQRVYVYASMHADTDTRDAKYQAMKQEMNQLYATFSAAVSFIEPEILKMDPQTLESFVAREPRLQPYAFYLRDIQRRKAHTLSEGEEKIIADAQLMAPASGEIYNTFTNADFPFPTVTLADGSTRKLDLATFSVSRSLPNREDRQKVFTTFFGAVGRYNDTLGATMNANLQSDLFYMRARGIDESDARALLTVAFAATALERIADAELRAAVAARVNARLAALTGVPR